MESRKPYLATLPGLILGCLVCCALWGSAFPCIKIGYGLFGIPAHDSASQLLFAGLRFTLAGALVIVGMSAAQRRPLIPQARDIKPIFVLSLFQTIGQYFFFYLGLSRASAMSSSIIEASANFLAILFAALAFHTEKLNTAKVLGCVLGFTGVALVNLSGADGTFGFTLDGEGFILASTVAGALSTCLIGIFSREHDGVLLAGWQFLVGGVVLTAIGFLMGGTLSPTEIAPAIALIIYMALISAVAYSLWSRLLAVNPVSRVSVFGFMNPVFGVLLSALLLGEGAGTSPVTVIVALLLVCGGIIIVNKPKKPSELTFLGRVFAHFSLMGCTGSRRFRTESRRQTPVLPQHAWALWPEAPTNAKGAHNHHNGRAPLFSSVSGRRLSSSRALRGRAPRRQREASLARYRRHHQPVRSRWTSATDTGPRRARARR